MEIQELVGETRVYTMNRYITMFIDSYADQHDENGNRLLGVVTKNIDKMYNLMDAILSFTQLGKKEFERETISMKIWLPIFGMIYINLMKIGMLN